MLLKAPLRIFNLGSRHYCSHFSSEFSNFICKDNSTIPHAKFISLQSNFFETLNNFSKHSNKETDLLGQLIQLRKQKESTDVSIFPSIVLPSLLKATSLEELYVVLRKPLQYGVFIDQTTGCYLIDKFLSNAAYKEAMQIAIAIVELDKYDNELIKSISLKACYEYMKLCANKQQMENVPPTDNAPEPVVIKKRVKFMRSNDYVEAIELDNKKIGKSILQLSDINDVTLKNNFQIFGLLLSGQFRELENHLCSSNMEKIDKNVMEISYKLLSDVCETNNDSLRNVFSSLMVKCVQTDLVENKLNALIESCLLKDKPKLIDEFNKECEIWINKYDEALQNQIRLLNKQQSLQQIEEICKNIEKKRQNLWFFEEKDKNDLLILKNKVYYPKKWFGKKKKPRAADSFYIPPDIRKTT